MNRLTSTFSRAFFLSFLLALLSGCGAPYSGPNSWQPTITSFTATPAEVTAGESTRLTGVFANGTGVVVPGNISVTSNTAVSVSPASTTTYALTVTNTAGATTTMTATVTVTALKAQTITFVNPGTQNVGTPLNLVGSSTSGLTVAFTSQTTGVCTISGTTATFLATGTCTIDAKQAGNTTYAAATMVPQSFTVDAALKAQTITFVNPGTQNVGTPLNLVGSSTSGLTVAFTSQTTGVCTISGTTATFLATGTCTIDAKQAGNTTYAAATMVPQSFTVDAALKAQTITFVNPGTQNVGTPLNLVGSSTSGLTVAFTSQTTGVCTISGTTATFLATGTCTIDAKQAGNTTYAAATMVPQSFTVDAALKAQTITFVNPGTQNVGTPLNLVGSSTSGLTVAFTSQTTGVCTISGTTATFLATGTCTIDAKQAGNTTYAAATMVPQSFTVDAALKAQTITFVNPGTQNVGTPLNLVGSSTSGLTVAFTSQTTGVCTISGTTATFLATGTCTIDAKQAGNTTYAAATMVPQSFTVDAALKAQTITFTDGLPATAVYSSGLSYSISATGGGSGNPVTFTVSGPATLASGNLTITGTGTVTVTANQAAGNGYMAASAASQGIVISTAASNPVPTILAIMPAALRIGNSPQTVTVTGTNFLPTTTATYGGASHAINYVNSTTVTIALSTSDIAAIDTYNIVLTNPVPGGGSVSTPFYVFAASPVLDAPSVDVYRPTWALTHAYYIDANLGNDNNNGTSSSTAWKTLTKIHGVVLVPGDVVYLARNSVWTNQSLFFDNGSAGSTAKPIVIEAYGTGAAPTISFPAAVWSSSTPNPAISFGHGSTTPTHDLTILDLLITDYAGTAISLDVTNYDIVIAGNEIARTGMGVGIHGQHQKVIANYIHDGVEVINDGNGDDSWGANGVGVVGQDIEIAWNRFVNCSALSLAFGNDGGAVEFFGNEPTTADPSGWSYVSSNIRIHHNLADYTDGFMESTGAVNGIVVAYNIYVDSVNEALEFHMDNPYGSFQNVSIENNTFVPRMEPSPGGWGIVGELVDGSTPPTGPQSITVRNNIFATNFRIVGDNPIGANLVHDHNTFWLLNSGILTGDPTNFQLASTEREANPQFVDYPNLNLQLQSASPAIGAGVTLATGVTDLDNELVDVLGTALPATSPDEGAYQHSAVTPPVNNPAPTITGVSPSFVVAGSASQVIEVTGTSFLSTTTAIIAGTSHSISAQTSVSLQLTLSAGDQVSAGSVIIQLTNPAPGGGTASISLPIVPNASALASSAQLEAGNQARLQNLILKARSGQKVTIAAIGGSITEGVAATAPADRYLNLFQTWWNGQFSGGSTLLNAGIGATDSDYGGSARAARCALTKPRSCDCRVCCQ